MASHCLCCQAPIRLGTLCPEHSSQLATTDTLIAEHVVARAEAEPLASLVDQWGRVHGVSERFRVGRSTEDSELAILHPSVSSVHAELRRDGDKWQLVDRGSLNGTTRNGQPHSRGVLEDGDLVRFGDVALFFLARRPDVGPKVAGALGATVPTKQKELGFEARLRCPSGDLELLQRPGGGIVSKPDDSSSIELARLEFSLLMLLAERSSESSRADLAYVSTSELVSLLDFRSRDADTDNVRELIRRVRRKLKGLTSDPVIESRQGAGYRIAWPVLPAS